MTPDLVTGSSCEILKKQQGLLQSLPESQRGEIRSPFHYRPVKMGKSIFFAQSAVMQRLDGGKYNKKQNKSWKSNENFLATKKPRLNTVSQIAAGPGPRILKHVSTF